MEHFLDLHVPIAKDGDHNPKLLEILDDMLFDALNPENKKQTMSSYIYLRLSKLKKNEILEAAKKMFEKKLHPTTFLGLFESPLRNSLINAIAQMASTRKASILELIKKVT